MNIPITGEIGELISELRAALIDGVQQRVSAAGFGDVKAIHDCVFRYLSPDGTRLQELAARSNLTPQSIGWHVDELERLGYVERIPDPADRRAKLIRPTERGLAFMAATKDALADIEKRWVRALGKATLIQLRDTLAAIRSIEDRSQNSAHRA
jgi:DNA-binding MarR family transcriptional regulator